MMAAARPNSLLPSVLGLILFVFRWIRFFFCG
uniref:Uncharacterized protein n=1 Tax=Arundo donax TaxID=35708 RepID=A0A0A8YLI9_ARUDO